MSNEELRDLYNSIYKGHANTALGGIMPPFEELTFSQHQEIQKIYYILKPPRVINDIKKINRND